MYDDVRPERGPAFHRHAYYTDLGETAPVKRNPNTDGEPAGVPPSHLAPRQRRAKTYESSRSQTRNRPGSPVASRPALKAGNNLESSLSDAEPAGVPRHISPRTKGGPLVLTTKSSPRKPYVPRAARRPAHSRIRTGRRREPLSRSREGCVGSETSEHTGPALNRGPPEPGRAPVQRKHKSAVPRRFRPRNGAGSKAGRWKERAPVPRSLQSRSTVGAASESKEWKAVPVRGGRCVSCGGAHKKRPPKLAKKNPEKTGVTRYGRRRGDPLRRPAPSESINVLTRSSEHVAAPPGRGGSSERGGKTHGRYLVDPASSYMLVSKIKPCRSKYRPYTAKLRMAH